MTFDEKLQRIEAYNAMVDQKKDLLVRLEQLTIVKKSFLQVIHVQMDNIQSEIDKLDHKVTDLKHQIDEIKKENALANDKQVRNKTKNQKKSKGISR